MSQPVLQVISGDLWAGAEAQCYYLCAELTRQDVPLQAVLFNDGELANRLRDLGFTVRVWDEGSSSAVDLLRRASRLLKEQDFSLIHTHGRKESVIFGLANALLGRRLKLLNTVHGAEEYREPWYRLKKQLIRFSGYLTTRFLISHTVAVSRGLAVFLGKTAVRDRMTLIENAIDITAVRRRAAAETPIALPPGDFKLMMLARAVPLKRHDLAIDAVRRVTQRHRSCVLLIVGDGPTLPSLKRQTGEQGLTQRVLFLGELTNPYPVLRQVDALIMPSDHEGMPMALLEAFALGVPVIGHDVGGIHDVLSNVGYGTAVADHSATGYADAIERLIDTQNLVLASREEAQEKFAARFGIEGMVQKYQELYRALS